MTTHNGYLLMADISGYTQFLTSSEQDHANPILHSLLSALVEQKRQQILAYGDERGAIFAREIVRSKIGNQQKLLRYFGKYVKRADPAQYPALGPLS